MPNNNATRDFNGTQDFQNDLLYLNEEKKFTEAQGPDYLGGLLKREQRRRWLAGLFMLPFLLVGLLGFVGFTDFNDTDSWPDPEGLPFRLHIIANSDSAADQALKLQVRDCVVEYLTPLLAEAESREQAEQIVRAHLGDLTALAAGLTKDFGYGARAEVGEFDFPAKRYGEVCLPAGKYQALRLSLGEAAGHNWWCVLFPPLCFVDECGEFRTTGEGAAGSLLAGERQVRLKLQEIFYQEK